MARHGENIRKRKDGRWEGRYKVFDESKDRYTYRSVYGNTYEEAKEKLICVKFNAVSQIQGERQIPNLSESGMGKNSAEALIPFSRAAQEWLGEIAAKQKYATYVKYETIYRTHLAEMTGSVKLSTEAIWELQAKISDHLTGERISESLQRSIRCVANQIVLHANREYSLCIPVLEKPPAKPKKKTIETLSRTEQARLLSGIHDGQDKFKVALLLCLYTGLRLGELCALRWTDLDFEDMTMTVNRTVQRVSVRGHVTKTVLLETDPKSKSSQRIIPLTLEIAELLRKMNKTQLYVFGGNTPLEPRTMQYRFKKILRIVEIEDRNFHILRHRFATNCIENGMDVKSLSEILGHSDVKITLNRYVHPTMDSKRRQIGMLPNFYGQICGHAA